MDLVERLREWAHGGGPLQGALMVEAADEIEGLRKQRALGLEEIARLRAGLRKIATEVLSPRRNRPPPAR